MKTIRIENGKTVQLSKNLTMQEVWNSTNPQQEWGCPQALIDAFQIIRDWIDKPLICSSTYRNPDRYGRGSSHEEGNAIDMYSKVVDVVTLYNLEVENYVAGRGSELIDKLRSVGIDGFGIEKHCIHLETGGYGVRKGRKIHTDKYGKYTGFIWTGWGPNDINRSI